MKLIHKTIIYYLLISLPLLIIAGFFSYELIKTELEDGTDEALQKENLNAQKFISTFETPKNVVLSIDNLSSIIYVKNNLKGQEYNDTTIYDNIEQENINYRILKSYFNFNGNNYLITVSKATLEEGELMEGLLSSFVIIISLLVVAFFIVNFLISKNLWKPFYKTLSELNNYDIKKHESHSFQQSKTLEFNQLNAALNKMTEKIHSDFLQQKEFTENASHEMQTPIAVIKASMSLLMQSSNLNEEEMNQLQSIENTLKKLSSLNKSLLLLTKIENNQFKENESISLNEVITKNINNYSDLIQLKNIQLEVDLAEKISIKLNPILADILISNLLQNAIRHNIKSGKINIKLKNNSLMISNNGEPLTISKSDLFVRFKKNDASKDSLGLGLSIVKSITDKYDYKIAYSFQDSLHTFTIQFI
jgi:signal transduction histidine kinase